MQFLISAISPRIQFVRRIEALPDIVHSDCPIETASNNICMLFVKVQASDGFHLLLSLEHTLRRSQIPDLYKSIVVP
jgi:hypothetical protein